jgi:small nuclear ribonucleoprotein (snRNP)-like protein
MPDPPSRTAFREKVRQFYLKHNPGNLKNLEEILTKYSGNEEKLFALLERKYGTADASQREVAGNGATIVATSSKTDLRDPKNSQRPGHQVDRKEENLKEIEGRRGRVERSQAKHVASAASTAKAVKQHLQQNVDHSVKLDLALDFRSSQFNPLMALNTESLRPPVAVRPLDNLSKTRDLLPPDHEDFSASVAMGIIDPGAAEIRQRKNNPSAEQQVREDASNPGKKLLRIIAEKAGEGPLKLLLECLQSKSKIRVTIRHVNGVRGTCTGLLKGFDKHMNLILLAVHER